MPIPESPYSQYQLPNTWNSREYKIQQNKEKQKILNTFGYNIPVNGNWGQWQETQWRKIQPQLQQRGRRALVHPTYSDSERKRRVEDRTRLQQLQAEADKASAPWRKAADIAHNIGVGASTVAGLAGAILAPVATVGAIAGGYLGGKAVDTGTKLTTGKTWAENVKERLGLHSDTLAEMTNLGTLIGGGFGYKYLPLRAKTAIYDNISPIGYSDGVLKGLQIKKMPELKAAAKDFFLNPKLKLKPNTNNPKWMQRLESQENYQPNKKVYLHNNDGNTFNMVKLKDFIDFRNQSWAKTLGYKNRTHKLYLSNGDETYRYNMDYINPKLYRYDSKSNKYIGTGWNGKVGVQPNIGMKHFDSITGSGGGVGVVDENGQLFMYDIWDAQPFIDGRTMFPTLHKIPGIRNFEIVQHAANRKPLILKHQINKNLNPIEKPISLSQYEPINF